MWLLGSVCTCLGIEDGMARDLSLLIQSICEQLELFQNELGLTELKGVCDSWRGTLRNRKEKFPFIGCSVNMNQNLSINSTPEHSPCPLFYQQT